MSCVCMIQRGQSGDGCVLASTLCKYDMRKYFLAMRNKIVLFLYDSLFALNKLQRTEQTSFLLQL